MKKALLLLAAVSLNGVVSGVGAQDLQGVDAVPTELAIALVETGVSNRWTTEASHTVATQYDTQKLETRIEVLGSKMSQEIERDVSTKLDALLANAN